MIDSIIAGEAGSSINSYPCTAVKWGDNQCLRAYRVSRRRETTGGLLLALAGTDAASCITVGRVLIASFQRFAINRFANINMHAYYNTVRGAIIGFAIWPDLTRTQLKGGSGYSGVLALAPMLQLMDSPLTCPKCTSWGSKVLLCDRL